VVEVELRDGRRLVKRRRDFLTGGLVEQAVAGAIDRAVADAEAGDTGAALSAEGLIDALREHIDGLAEILSADNAADYLELPSNAQVAAVHRVGDAATLLPPLLSDLESN
jgi:hypothetical protein